MKKALPGTKLGGQLDKAGLSSRAPHFFVEPFGEEGEGEGGGEAGAGALVWNLYIHLFV